MHLLHIDPKKILNSPRKTIDSPLSVATALTLVKFENRVICLSGGKIFYSDSDGEEVEDFVWKEWKTSLKPISNIVSKFGSLFLTTEDGRLYCHGAILNDLKIKYEDDEFVKLQLAKKSREPCPHGKLFDCDSDFFVKNVNCTFDSVFVVDFNGRLWAFDKKNAVISNDGVIQVSAIKISRRVLEVHCGRDHCVALCQAPETGEANQSKHADSTYILLPDNSISDSLVTSTPRKSSINENCTECLDDVNCRLSLLMQEADDSSINVPKPESTQADVTGSPTAKSVAGNEKETPPSTGRRRFRFDRLRSHFRSYQTAVNDKISPKSKTSWYTASLPVGFGSSRSLQTPTIDVELDTFATLPRAQAPAVTDLAGSATFDYVNLDTFVDLNSSYSTTPESLSKRPSVCATLNEPATTDTVVAPRETEAVPVELWSWGSNQKGQLGHGDTISRREPKQIRGIGSAIVKVTIGDHHNVVVTATGEAFVWGSNANGQLKQMNQEFVERPTVWRLGAESSVVDAVAGEHSTVVIVTSPTINAQPALFIFGNAVSATSSMAILNCQELNGYPVAVKAISAEDIWMCVVPTKTDDITTSVENVYSQLKAIMRSTKVSAQLTTLAGKLLQSDVNADVKSLFDRLASSVSAWSRLQTQFAVECMKTFVTFSDLTLTSNSSAKTNYFQIFCRTLLDFHFALMETIAFRCFNDIHLESDVAVFIDRLSVDNNAESTQQHRRLRNLFSLIFDVFKTFRGIVEKTATEPLPLHFWRHFDRTLDRNTKFAKQTYRLAGVLKQNGLEHGVLRPGRLIVWTSLSDDAVDIAQQANSRIKVREISRSSTWRRLMSSNFTTLVVFSDAVALIQRNEHVLLESPLVWLSSMAAMASSTETSSEEDLELGVQIVSPEFEFQVFFPTVEMKNSLLSAFSISFRLHKERTELQIFDDNAAISIHALPQTRYGVYEYSPSHGSYRNCTYRGFWRKGVPHGEGRLFYPDGREYKGHFVDGKIHGMGEMKIPDDRKSPTPTMSSVFFSDCPLRSLTYNYYKGHWRNGRLNGLAFIRFANGDMYEGYCVNGQPQGHGVHRTTDATGNHKMYVGGWLGGLKHGYGVLSLNKERYLGMWKDDVMHEKGCHITIDGVFHEGLFEKDRFVKGRMVYQTSEADPPASYEGEFERLGVAAGKGVLKLTPWDQIEGVIHGAILGNELKIVNATYARRSNQLAVNDTLADLQILEDGPVKSEWSVMADYKWQEIFDQFLHEELGFRDPNKTQEEQCARAWERISTALERLRSVKDIALDERLSRVPDVTAPWSLSYYLTVTEFWNLCVSLPQHPIHRLVNGLVEIFCCSYNNIGTHSVMYDSAVLEFISLIQRTYNVVRHLFPSLPSVREMYRPIPQSAVVGEKDADELSMEELNRDELSDTSNKDLSDSSAKERQAATEEFNVTTPCCDFVINHLFRQCYAELFTMYSVKCHAMDKKYWDRVVFLNAATDARLLIYFGVERNLWPTATDESSDLDKFMLRVTARKKYYETAITTLQRLSCEFNPSIKLAILAETFSEISMCVSQFSSVGRSHVWSGDDLLPAFMYVVVRAQLQHLGAEIRLISDFCPQLNGAGQMDMMFTMLCASYVQICNEKSVP